jgi:D-alanyl-D-alanine carboxypeptidase
MQAQFDAVQSPNVHDRNTNKLRTDVEVRGGKTGFIRKAGYCFATLLQVPQGSQLAVVVLGAANSAVRTGGAALVQLGRWADPGVV